MESEIKPFLTKDENDTDHRETAKQKWKLLLVLLWGFILGVLITVLIFFAFMPREPMTAYSNAPFPDLMIRYIPKPFISDRDSPYAQAPGSEVDCAWDSLLSGMHMRASAEELVSQGQTSVSLEGGDRYLVWLDVYHQLHCINMLRKWIYRGYYHPNMTDMEYRHLSPHADHCLDILRQAVLCHPDPSLTTFRWSVSDRRPMFNTHSSLHTCVDFDALMKSVKDRKVDEAEVRRLRNPLFGGIEQ